MFPRARYFQGFPQFPTLVQAATRKVHLPDDHQMIQVAAEEAEEEVVGAVVDHQTSEISLGRRDLGPKT